MLRPGEDAATDIVIPLLLKDIVVAMEVDIAALGVERTEHPGTLVANLLPAGVNPGVEQRVGRGLHLLVRGHIDRLVGIISVGTGARVAAKACRVGHGRVDGVAAEEVMIRAEGIAGALRLRAIKTQVLARLGEDEEDRIYT